MSLLRSLFRISTRPNTRKSQYRRRGRRLRRVSQVYTRRGPGAMLAHRVSVPTGAGSPGLRAAREPRQAVHGPPGRVAAHGQKPEQREDDAHRHDPDHEGLAHRDQSPIRTAPRPATLPRLPRPSDGNVNESLAILGKDRNQTRFPVTASFVQTIRSPARSWLAPGCGSKRCPWCSRKSQERAPDPPGDAIDRALKATCLIEATR